MHGHSKSDARNLALHRAAFDKLEQDASLVQTAVDLIDRWLVEDVATASRRWLLEWREMLTTWPLERVASHVLDEERGQTLRQCSPLAPVLTPRERWAVLRTLRVVPTPES